MVETTALSPHIGVRVTGVGSLLGETVIATCLEALKWRGVLLIRDLRKKRIDNLRVVHSFEAAQRGVIDNPTGKQLAAWRRIPANEVCLVWERADGRRSMVLGSTADHIVGLAEDEGRALPYEVSSQRTLHRTTVHGAEAFK